MNTRLAGAAGIALVSALALTACAANETPSGSSDDESTGTLSGTLVGGGASSQGTAQAAWIAAIQGNNPDLTIEYDPAGSGAGRDTFIAGGSAFAGSDRAFNDEEIAEGGFAACAADSPIIEIPAYVSPIAIAFNLEGIDSLNLTPEVVANIFNGTITSWDDAAIADLNPDAELPALAITAVHRADDSGTTENFTAYLGEVAPEAWPHEADGVWPLTGGEAASQTSGVVDAVTGGNGYIGYMDASRAEGLGTVAIGVGEDFVAYSAEAAAAVVDASPFVEGRAEGDLAIELDRTTDAAGVYPIVLVSYLIACEQYEDAAQAELVSSYFSYIVSEEGQNLAAEEAGSAPISDTLRTAAEDAIALIG